MTSTANTPAQKSLQLAEVARSGQAAAEGDTFRAFYRYVAEVAGQLCEHSNRNGHMVTDTAHKCGIGMAEAELDTLPETVDMDAKLAAVAITIVPVPRYLGVKADGTDCGCTFGHKTSPQATACARGTKAAAGGMTRRQARVAIPVRTGPALGRPAAVQAEAPKTDTPDTTPAPAQTGPTTPNQDKPATRKLRSGKQGTV